MMRHIHSSKCNELAKLLNQMARESPDKAFAEKLVDFAKIIKDRALQV